MVNALFQQDNNIYTPTEKTTGPWGPDRLHGGATAGLIGHALEQASGRDDLSFVRLSIDMFRPVPLAPLTVESKVIRDGNRVEVIETTIFGNGKAVAKGSALKIMPKEVEVPDYARPPGNELTHPDKIELMTSFGEQVKRKILPGFIQSIQIKRICGFEGSGEGKAWFRVVVPVVEGKETSPFVHIATLCDFGNGLSQLYTSDSGGSINADITLYLHRIPAASWVGLDSKSTMQNHGIGLVNTQVYDTEGMVGSVTQAIMPQPILVE